MNVSKLAEHFRSHFTSTNPNSISGIDHEGEHDCPIPSCRSSEKMLAHQFLTHLDFTHGFEFTICNEDHEHSQANCQAELPYDFRFFYDDVEESAWPVLNRPLPARSAVDRRKSKRVKDRSKAIAARAAKANEALVRAGKEEIPRLDKSNAHLPPFTRAYFRNREDKKISNPAPSLHIARFSRNNDILRLPEETRSDDTVVSLDGIAMSETYDHPDQSFPFDVDDVSDVSNIPSATLATSMLPPSGSSTSFEEGDNPFGDFVEFSPESITRLIA
ncbi:hypothetical protein BKA70DRAFT_1228551 [Coprinopsis sp. MPI-PUGE-AT-0042]|nr:hypothetical protein BKA70DRAFT_1228551 [Coprinopsis sp. MPI-PUGE-AT-0042]